LLLLALVAGAYALSCREGRTKSERREASVSVIMPKANASDLVPLDRDQGAAALLREQTFDETEPSILAALPSLSTRSTTLSSRGKRPALTSEEDEDVEGLRQAPPPPDSTLPAVTDDADQQQRTAIPFPPTVPPPSPPVRTILPMPPPDKGGWTASEVAIGVGTVSIAVGAAAAMGDGTPENRIFAGSMMGAGLASYAVAGILSLKTQDNPARKKHGGTPAPSVSVGPGLSVQGQF